MRPGGATRVIALLLALGMIVTVASTFLAQAGVGMWGIALVVLLILALPIFLLSARR